MSSLALRAVLSLLFFFPFSLYAQVEPSGEVLKKAAALLEEKKTGEAISLYKSIAPGDSNYAQSLYDLSRAYYADSQMQEALRYCRLGVEQYNEYQHYFMNLEGNILDDMSRDEEAKAAYRRAISRYPNYIHPYTNLAIVMNKNQRYDSAEALMQSTLLSHPFSSVAHFRLASAALQQGKIIQAYMAYAASLLVEPDGQFFRSAIESMDKLARGNEDFLAGMNDRSYTPDANYASVEQLFLSRLALEAGYKTKAKLSEPLLKQLYMITEKLEFRADDTDFYIQYYLPLFRKILADKQVDEWFYHLLAGIEVDEVNNYLQQHRKDVDAFKSSCVNYLQAIRTTRRRQLSERTAENVLYHYENGFCSAKGKMDGDKHTGPWEFYFSKGQLKGRGSYIANDKREGTWVFYHENGNLSSRETYREGMLQGPAEGYAENGVLNFKGSFADGKKNGKATEYHDNGVVSIEATFREGKENGPYRTYYRNGKPSLEINTVDGKGNGTFRRFYENGNLQTTGRINNGEQDGAFRYYHENGQLESEGQMLQDQREGTWKSYYENGVLKSVEQYEKGSVTGERTVYHDNGKLQYREMRGKSGTEGDVEFFDRDGVRYSLFTYKNGILAKAVYFDKQGKEVSTSVARGKEIDLDYFSPDGVRYRSAHYNASGNTNGKETMYYGSGKVDTESFYQDGKTEGLSVTYHKNGRKKYEVMYADDNKTGPYKAWYPHGQLEKEGNLEEGSSVGNWIYYDELGSKTTRLSYFDGGTWHFEENYYPNGQVEMTSRYRGEEMDSLIQFDTLGRVMKVHSLPNGNGHVDILQVNGKIFSSGDYVHGRLHGLFTTYYPDGKLLSRVYFRNGLQDSTAVYYSHEGKVFREGSYDKGMKTGTWKYYTEDGDLMYTETYKSGKLEGSVVHYYANGKVDREVPYTNGVRDGWTKKFAETGDLMYQVRYYDTDVFEYTYLDAGGKLLPPIPLKGGNGKLKAFYSNGKPSAEIEFEASEYMGTHLNWHPNGTKTYESPEIHDLTHGIQKKWYADGKPRSATTFWNNMMLGPHRVYHPNGKPKTEGEYYLDKQHGAWKHFDASGKLIKTEVYYYGRLLEIKTS